MAERRMEKHIPDAARPYRLYNGTLNRWFLWYYYVHKVQAMRMAHWIAKWLPVGEVIEVIDVRDGRLHGAYKRHADGSVTPTHETLKRSPVQPKLARERK
jgi:hypothetical protein